MKFSLSFEFIYRYCNKVHTKHDNFFQYVQYITGRTNAVNCCRGIYLFICVFIFDYKAVCLCKKTGHVQEYIYTSLQLQHFWINFWCLVLLTYENQGSIQYRLKWELFFKKKGAKNFTTSFSIPFLSLLHQNKALHNFHQRTRV